MLWLMRYIDGKRFGAQKFTLTWYATRWDKRDIWVGIFWNRTEYDDGLSVYICLIPCHVTEWHFEPTLESAPSPNR